MYNLLIADDEPLVQVGIKSMLNYESMGINVCHVAANGSTAFDYIKENPVDIVITDIKMPIMSGLQLAKKCQEELTNPPYFIVLTSYEDFKLAQEAIHCGVSDYLIKLELTPEVLKNSLEKITAELDKKSNTELVSEVEINPLESYRDKFFIRLLHNLFEDRSQFELQANELKLTFDNNGYTAAYVEIVPASKDVVEAPINAYLSAYQMCQGLFDKYATCYCLLLDLHHFAVIFENSSENEIVKAVDGVSASLKGYYNVCLLCGLGNSVEDPLQISDSFQFARYAFKNASFEAPCSTALTLSNNVDYKNSFNFAIFKEPLSRAFEEFDNNVLTATLDELIELFKSHPGHSIQAMDLASNILYMAISLIPKGEEVVSSIFADCSDGYRCLYKLSGTEQITGWLSALSRGLSDYFAEHKKETRKPIVSNIKHYIQNNLTEPVSLNEVAAVFGISPNYLSQLFKKYNECGLNEYVTNCKITEAKRLLSTGEYKVYEVSDMLGFENAFYFSKVFKKVVGVPPTTFMSKE